MGDSNTQFKLPESFAEECIEDIPFGISESIEIEEGVEVVVGLVNEDATDIAQSILLARKEISVGAKEFEVDALVSADTVVGDVGNAGGEVVVVGAALVVSGTMVQEMPFDPIEQLLKAAKSDVGACLEPEALAMLAELSLTKPAAFMRLRDKIKAVNPRVSLVALDKAIAQSRTEDAPLATHHVFAKGLLEDLTFGGHKPVSAEGVVYVNDPKTNIWNAVTPEELERQVADLHDGKPNCERRGDYNNVAIHALNLCADPQYFANAPVGFACPGGFYHVVSGDVSVEPLTPMHRQRLMLPFTPVQRAMPMFEQFLNETFHSEREGEEEQQIARLQEIFGAAMFGLMQRFHKSVMFYDPFGRAGKGTASDILVALVPPEFVTNVSPFKWRDEYYLATLARSRLNLVGELPENTPLPAAEFKTVTGGDILTGRHPTGRPFTFRNQAAHICSSNHFPNTRDQSDAFFFRWLMVEFPNSRLRSGLALDVGLAARIVANELPGIAYWAMQGGLRLLQNGKFSESMAGDRLMAKWRQSTNSLEEYIGECCDIGEKLYSVKRAALYEGYVAWCRVSGRKPYSKGHVKDLLEHNIKLDISLGSKDGYELFRGIQFKKPDEASDIY
jgi:P4 family phage/plasmid primase-like protien